MKRENISIVILWLIIIGVVGFASWYGIREAVGAALKIAVAIIGAAAILLGAILTHALTALREQELERRKQMQENYKALVDKIAIFIRKPEQRDEFETIHLHSWVVGSPNVILRTQAFMGAPDASSLKKVLAAMRADLGLREAPEKASLANVLQSPKPSPGLPPT